MKSKEQIIDRMLDYCHIISRRNGVKKQHKKYFKMLRENNIPIKRLSREQKKQVDAVYKKYGFSYKYDTHELVYSVTGEFSPHIVPEDMFRTEIEIYLNDYDSKYVISDKSYFDIFMPDVMFPHTIVRNIDGILYDNSYNIISEEQALELIKKYDQVVFKPSKENGVGRGVALLDTKKDNPFKISKKDYILQERLVQHPVLANLNSSSVNVVRVVTTFIDNEVFVITASLRVGAKGEFTDNSITADGKGMIVIGIDADGRLKENGYHSCGVSTRQTALGLEFKGIEVPQYFKMLEIARKSHSLYPRLRFMAWDFTVSENDNVICMEYNVRGPGVLYYQYANGPLFGKYAQKILEHAKSEKKKRQLF